MAPVTRSSTQSSRAAAEHPRLNESSSHPHNRDARGGSNQNPNGRIFRENNGDRARRNPNNGSFRAPRAFDRIFRFLDIMRIYELYELIPEFHTAPQSNDEAYTDAINQYNTQREACFNPNLESRNKLMCNICMNPYRDRAPTAVQCGHVYCRECIDHRIQGGNATCIQCNAAISSQALTRLFP